MPLPPYATPRARIDTARRIAALALPLGLIALGATPAHSAPTSPTAPSSTHAITSRSTYATDADTAAQTVHIAVPAGVTPTSVSGTVTFQGDGASSAVGQVAFLLGDKVVRTVPKQAATAGAPFTFPVGASDVVDGYLDFSFRYTTDGSANPADGCAARPDLGNAQIDDVTLAVSGQETTPPTVADFFGPAVHHISVVVPDDAEPAVRQAGLAAVAATAHVYGNDADVDLTGDDVATVAAAAGVGDRAVVVSAGTGAPEASVSATDGLPTLTLAGDPARLSKAAAALGSDMLALTDSGSSAHLEQSGVAAAEPTHTFASLGQATPTVHGLGTSEFGVSAKLSDFGRSVSDVKVHLVGQHSAVPDSVSAMLSYYWNGQLIGSRNVTGDGDAIDQDITVPASKLSAFNTLDVKMVAIPARDQPAGTKLCGTALAQLPIEVDFDGTASTLTATPGQPFAPGFTRFPQTLDNVMTVAVGSRPGALADAAALVASLQRLNTAELDVRLVPVATFIGSSAPGLVVGATSSQVAALDAPLKMAAFRTIDAKDVHFGAGVDAPYAALQAFEQNGRDVLLLSSWSPASSAADTGDALEQHLVDWLDADPNGWYSLHGDLAVAQSATADPVQLDSHAVSPQPATVHHVSKKARIAVIAAGVLLVAMCFQLLARRQVRRRAAKLVDAEILEADDRGPKEQ